MILLNSNDPTKIISDTIKYIKKDESLKDEHQQLIQKCLKVLRYTSEHGRYDKKEDILQTLEEIINSIYSKYLIDRLVKLYNYIASIDNMEGDSDRYDI